MTTQTPDRSMRRRTVLRTIVVIIVLAAAVIGIAVGVGIKKPWSSLATPDTAMLHTITAVKSGEAMTLSLSPLKVSIDLAKNVLGKKGYLSLTARDAGPFQEVDVCFSVNPDSWSVYFQDEASFQVQYYDKNEVGSQWFFLPTYGRVETQQICGQARHLTLFALATTSSTEPLLPVTGPLYEGQ